ncbi:MAG TPA: sulfotransferase domain-containing protein [Candidatus Limnocylindrales bacterium]|nr:sulfotransferase domain-containing protein [Candidatus Limnocylindrales bacterium]
MNYILICGLIAGYMFILAGCWLGWQLLSQNGRILLRLDRLEKQLDRKAEDETAGTPSELAVVTRAQSPQAADTNSKADAVPGFAASAPDNGRSDRSNRFSDRSLVRSQLKRDGLKAGTSAPEFRLPRVEGGGLSLAELRGRVVLLVFSSPNCGPCNNLAPRLEAFHQQEPGLELVMISRGEPAENRDKVKEHGLTFPVLLQRHWEVSRDYATFVTPVAYLIDTDGIIRADVAVGVDAIESLLARAKRLLRPDATAATPSLLKRFVRWPVAAISALLPRLGQGLGIAMARIHLFELRHFKFVPRPDDIFIVTYPRSGTTWMQMILYQLTTDGNMDIPHIAQHCPWFERSLRSGCGFENFSAPRIFKSHLSYRAIPKGPGRYIYVARDGRDVAVSYYNLYRNYNQYQGSFDEFFWRFMRGKLHYGSWFEHVEGWRKHRHDLNILFLSYEELRRDLEGCIRRISAFCQIKVPEETLPRIVERCSFDFMKQHERKFDPALEMLWENGTQLESFLRVGTAGAGARELTMQQRICFEQVRDDYAELTRLELSGAISGLAR